MSNNKRILPSSQRHRYPLFTVKALSFVPHETTAVFAASSLPRFHSSLIPSLASDERIFNLDFYPKGTEFLRLFALSPTFQFSTALSIFRIDHRETTGALQNLVNSPYGATQLQHLVFSPLSLDSEVHGILIGKFRALRSLELKYLTIDSKSFTCIVDGLKSSLQELILNDVRFQVNHGGTAAASSSSNQQVATLLEEQLPRFENLLGLTFCHVGDLTDSSLKKCISGFKHLQKFCLMRRSGYSQKTLQLADPDKGMIDFLPPASLTDLDLSSGGSAMKAFPFEDVGEKCPKLASLNLSYAPELKIASSEILGNFLINVSKSIRHLDFSYSPKMTSLFSSENGASNEWIKAFSRLDFLESLNLTSWKTYVPEILQQLVSLKYIKRLSIADCNFLGLGVEVSKTLVEFESSLVELNLSNNESFHLTYLLQALTKHSGTLEELKLAQVRSISIAAGEPFFELVTKEMSRLKFLNLWKCRHVTERDVEKVRAMINARIIF